MPLKTPLFPEATSEDWEARDAQERARVHRIMAVSAVVSAIVSMAGQMALTDDPHPWFVYPLLGTPLGMLVTYVLVIWMPVASSEGFMSFLWPNRGHAVQEHGYSQIQAMAAAGDVAGALAAYEDVIATTPTAILPRVQAAELYARGSDPARAARHFADLRRVPGCSPQHDLYATQRLVDLYDGALNQPQRSLTELRRIVERHPASREATFARQALERRKQAMRDAR